MKKRVTRFLALMITALSTYSAAAKELPILGIGHVGFQSSNLEVSRAFYTAFLGYEFAFAVSDPTEIWYFKINDDQFIKLVQVEGETDDDRLVEIALQVSDIQATSDELKRRGLEPSAITTYADGTRGVSLKDPDDHQLLFVEYVPDSSQAKSRGKFLGARRVSDRLWHTGVTVADEAKARAFYEETLGFKEIWKGTRTDGGPTAWVNVQMPGERGDYLEYMLVYEEPSRQRLGSMHHLCFHTDDIREAHGQMLTHGLPDITRYDPKIGRIGRWLFNVFDPDGTRSELMESKQAVVE